MSHYTAHAVNPRTNQVEEACFLDDYFGRHRCGVRFAGEEHVWRVEDVTQVPAPVASGEGSHKP